ncbi:MAG: hypothetical protein AB7D57_11130 [Desulfovibrionaceae bacterium]
MPIPSHPSAPRLLRAMLQFLALALAAMCWMAAPGPTRADDNAGGQETTDIINLPAPPPTPAVVAPATPAVVAPPQLPVSVAEPKPEPAPAPKVAPQPKPKAESAPQPKPEPNQAQAETPRPGQGLQIPEEAKRTGDTSFLEGCWVGTRPEYHTKRIVTERFCFGPDGVGKRFIIDPAVAGKCVGATRATVGPDGTLQMSSDRMYCSSGDNWGSADMVCRGEGTDTPCHWVFHDVNGASQEYRIMFVRE